jgi:hypothetical protein
MKPIGFVVVVPVLLVLWCFFFGGGRWMLRAEKEGIIEGMGKHYYFFTIFALRSGR